MILFRKTNEKRKDRSLKISKERERERERIIKNDDEMKSGTKGNRHIVTKRKVSKT